MKTQDFPGSRDAANSAGTACPGSGQVPTYASSALMAAHAEICIVHEGTTYRLRRTANGKLILTK